VACFFAEDLETGDDAACLLGVEDMESALLSGLELGSAGCGNNVRAIGLRVDIVSCVGEVNGWERSGRVLMSGVLVLQREKFACALVLFRCVCFHLHFEKRVHDATELI
jgi:hypothetical protein